MDAAVSGTSRERTRLRGDTLRIALWLETKRQPTTTIKLSDTTIYTESHAAQLHLWKEEKGAS